MKKSSLRSTVCWLGFAAMVPLMVAHGAEPDWSVKLEAAEACSCAPACPCVFGSAPTRGHCHINFWMSVKKGHYGNVRLDGVSLMMTDEMGKSRRYYFDTGASPEQVAAITNVFAQMPALKVDKVVSVEQVPLHLERTDAVIKFSAPASQVEMKPKKGKEGKAITIQNTGLEDYIQYVSVTNSHRSATLDFAYSGTSAATWKLEGESK